MILKIMPEDSKTNIHDYFARFNFKVMFSNEWCSGHINFNAEVIEEFHLITRITMSYVKCDLTMIKQGIQNKAYPLRGIELMTYDKQIIKNYLDCNACKAHFSWQVDTMINDCESLIYRSDYETKSKETDKSSTVYMLLHDNIKQVLNVAMFSEIVNREIQKKIFLREGL